MSSAMPASPLSPVDSVPPIDSTFGALLIATFFAIAVFETFHIILSTHACYYYLVTSASNPDARRSSVWSLGLTGVATNSVSSTNFHNAYEASAGTIETFIFKPFSEFQHHTNGFITAVLVNLIRSKHIGVKRMDVLLNTLILYTINTGLLTGTLDLLSFLFGLLRPNNLIYAGFGIVTTKLYANSLLAALNTRNTLRYGPNCALTMSEAGPNKLVATPRHETTNLSDVTQVEVQDPVVTSSKTETAENSQSFLTFELVGIAV
ncbi:hypothetical protein V8D89_001686 [Ganoderma adspersum]